MGRYQSTKAVAAEFTFEDRGDYLVFTRICYNLHIKRLPSMERIDEKSNIRYIRSFIEAPEYKIWFLEELMDSQDIYYTTTFGLLTE